jgi:hypothetical protein
MRDLEGLEGVDEESILRRIQELGAVAKAKVCITIIDTIIDTIIHHIHHIHHILTNYIYIYTAYDAYIFYDIYTPLRLGLPGWSAKRRRRSMRNYGRLSTPP